MLQKPLVLVCVAAGSLLLATGCERPLAVDPPADLSQAHEIRLQLTGGVEASEDEAAAEEVAGTGWGTIRGRFVLAEGATPRVPQVLTINKDTEVCGATGPIRDEVFLIDPETRGIKNVAIYVRDASRTHESAQPGGGTPVFDQKDCVFLTHVFPVVVGQTVLVKNSDPVGHNMNVAAVAGSPSNLLIPGGESTQYVPNVEETMPIRVTCNIHPWMLSWILPRENGYFAVTGEDGSFEIANLPAGEEVEFQVWHENATGPGGALPAGGGSGVEIDKRGRFQLNLNENEVRTLEIVLPGAAFQG